MRLTRGLCFFFLGAAVSMPLGCGGEDDTGSPLDLPDDPTAPLGTSRGDPDFPAGTSLRVAAAPPADAFVREAAEAFENETEVEVRIDVVPPQRAAAAFCRGDARVAVLPRPLSRPEAKTCDRLGPDARRTVAHQAAVIVANDSTAPGCLGKNDLRRLWRRGSRINELSDLKQGLPDGHVELLGPPRGRSTIDLFRQRALGGESLRAYRPVEDSPVLTESIEANPRAVGFYAYARIDESVPEPLSLVPVRAGAKCVAPTLSTIRSGEYPLARKVLLLGPNRESDSAAGQFASWAVTNRRRAGLTTEQVTAAQKSG